MRVSRATSSSIKLTYGTVRYSRLRGRRDVTATPAELRKFLNSSRPFSSDFIILRSSVFLPFHFAILLAPAYTHSDLSSSTLTGSRTALDLSIRCSITCCLSSPLQPLNPLVCLSSRLMVAEKRLISGSPHTRFDLIVRYAVLLLIYLLNRTTDCSTNLTFCTQSVHIPHSLPPRLTLPTSSQKLSRHTQIERPPDL